MPFDSNDAAALVRLAAYTEFPLDDLFIPGWELIGIFKTRATAQAQGFIVKGSLPSAPSTQVAVVAIGGTWKSFLQFYSTDFHNLQPVGGGILPVGKRASIDLGISYMYEPVRAALWEQVLFASKKVPGFDKKMPVFVCGLGPGGPLAQLAAIDLLPGHVWGQKTSPATSMAAYTFSSAPFGDGDFAEVVKSSVPDAWSVNLRLKNAGPDGFVDVWPTAPRAPYVLSGTQIGADAVPPYGFDPWIARGAAYYAKSLGGASSAAGELPQAKAADGTKERRPLQSFRDAVDAGFDPILGYSLALLCLAATARAQNKDYPFALPPGYLLFGDVIAGGVSWGSIYYKEPDRVVVALRGTLSWEDAVQTWASLDNDRRPSWLTLPGRVTNGMANLYDVIRQPLRDQLVALKKPSTALVFTGHDSGGALASLATLDLTLNPQAGVRQPDGLVTFGASPLGDFDFVDSFAAKVGKISAQVVRPLDVIPRLNFGPPGAVQTVPVQVLLDGTAPDGSDGSTFHPLTGYVQLLNPTQGTVPFQERELTASEEAHYQEGFRRLLQQPEINTCTLDSAEQGGRLVFSWEKQRSLIPAKLYHDWTAYIAMQRVIVRPGHTLIIEAPGGQPVHLQATELVLGPGSIVRVATEARLHVSRLVALEAAPGARESALPTFLFESPGGLAGFDGHPSGPGPAGGYRQAGADGPRGGGASDGGRGADLYTVVFSVGTLEGMVLVIAKAGDGGPGGRGGRGGTGGAGGPDGAGGLAPGGRGGAGGRGADGGPGGQGAGITITYANRTPGSEIRVETPFPSGGAAGWGGAGGAGGRGNPDGPDGSNGSGGSQGAFGSMATVTVRQRT
jgi:hypothetical protein